MIGTELSKLNDEMSLTLINKHNRKLAIRSKLTALPSQMDKATILQK